MSRHAPPSPAILESPQNVRHSNMTANRWIVIGRHGPITADQARRRAREILGRVALGEDPVGDRARSRAIPTLRRAFEDYFAAGPQRRDSTIGVKMGDELRIARVCLARDATRSSTVNRSQPTAVAASTRSSYRLSAVSGLTSPRQPSSFLIASGMSRQAPRLRAHGPRCPVAFFLRCSWSADSASLLY